MKRIAPLLYILPVLFLFLGCSVKKDYDLSKDLDYTVRTGQQIQVPIGSFSTIRIGDLLSKNAKNYFTKNDDGDYVFDPKGKVLTNFDFGNYHINGLGFVTLADYTLPSINFYFKIKNTLPFGFELSCKIIDEDGKPIDSFSALIDVDVLPGSEEEPSLTDAVLKVKSNIIRKGIGFDGFRILLTVEKMPASVMTIDHHSGIAIKNLKISFPEGLKFKLNDKFDYLKN